MKGIVADINEKNAVVLSENGEFVTVRNKNYSIGQRISCSAPSYTHFVSVAASIAFLVIGCFGGAKAYFTPTSYIDIDINPSFRLEINAFDRVVSVKPLNSDAIELIESSESFSHSIDLCISDIIDASKTHGYITDSNHDINISVISEKERVHERAKKCSNRISDNDNITISLKTDTKKHLEQAEKLNISVGKLDVIEKYCAINGGSVEENVPMLKEKSNADIMNMTTATENKYEKLTEPSEDTIEADVLKEEKNNKKTPNKNNISASPKPNSKAEKATKEIPSEVPDKKAPIKKEDAKENVKKSDKNVVQEPALEKQPENNQKEQNKNTKQQNEQATNNQSEKQQPEKSKPQKSDTTVAKTPKPEKKENQSDNVKNNAPKNNNPSVNKDLPNKNPGKDNKPEPAGNAQKNNSEQKGGKKK